MRYNQELVRNAFITVLITASFFLFAFFATTSYAQTNSHQVQTVAKGQTINGDYYAAGDQIEVSGTINGDVYAAGGQVIVDGTVNGDVLAAGGTITISGNVAQNVRVAGGNITISGTVGRNLSVTGGSITITREGTVKRNFQAAGGNIAILGPITGDAKIGAGSVVVSNTVGGAIDAGVGQLRLTGNAAVGKNLNYWSENPASIDNQATVSGSVIKHDVPQRPGQAEVKKASQGFDLFSKFASALTTFIIGALLLRLLPKYTGNSVETVKRRPWASLGLGFVGLIAIPFLAVILMATILGLGLGLILITLYPIALYISRIFALYAFGDWIVEKFDRPVNKYPILVLGIVIYYILQLIPVIGGITTFVVVCMGFGAALFATRGEPQRAAPAPAPSPTSTRRQPTKPRSQATRTVQNTAKSSSRPRTTSQRTRRP